MQKETQRTIVSWFLKFFLITAQIIGHTTALAFTIQYFGIAGAPWLFLGIGLISLLGTLLQRSLPKNIRKEHIILVYSAVLLLALPYIFSLHSIGALVSGIVIALGLVHMPLSIMVNFYIEELFSPLEAKKNLPIIESAEGVSLVVGGLGMITALSLGLTAHALLWIWLGSHILLSLILILWLRINAKFPSLYNLLPQDEHKKQQRTNYSGALKLMVGCLFLLLPLTELYFTSTFVSIFGESSTRMITGLSLFLVLAGIGTLFMQFLVGRKLLTKAGSMNTILTSPMLTGIMTLASLLLPGLTTAVLVRLVYESFLPILRLGYSTTFYALPVHSRLQVKSTIEGYIVPGAIVIASLTVVILEHIIHGPDLWFLLGNLILLISIAAIIVFTRLKPHYTDYIISHIHQSSDRFKANLIQILAEPGHTKAVASLHRLIKIPHEAMHVKNQILLTLGSLHHPESLPVIFQCLQHDDIDLRYHALRSLQSYSWQDDKLMDNGFSRYHLLEIIRQTFTQETAIKNKILMVELLSQIDHEHIIDFLIDALEQADDEVKPYVIRTIGRFSDPHIHHYVEPYLDSPNPWIQAYSICSLWQFPSYRLELLVKIVQMMNRKDTEGIKASTYLLGEIRSIQEQKFLLDRLHSDESSISYEAAIALLKIDDTSGMPIIIQRLMVSSSAYEMLCDRLNYDEATIAYIKKMLQKAASKHIGELIDKVALGEQQHSSRLEELYTMLDADEELSHLEELKATW